MTVVILNTNFTVLFNVTTTTVTELLIITGNVTVLVKVISITTLRYMNYNFTVTYYYHKLCCAI